MKLREALAWTMLAAVGVIGWANAGAITASAQNKPSISPATGTINLSIPAYCINSNATHRTYTFNIPAADNYARSGEHGHGKLTCIVFMTKTYSKVLTIDQSTGGYTIGANGVDVTYVDCGLPGYRFPPNNIDNGPNDCEESWNTTESNWTFMEAGQFHGQAMYPTATP